MRMEPAPAGSVESSVGAKLHRSARLLVLCLWLAPTALSAQHVTSHLEGGVLTVDVRQEHSALYWALDEVQRFCACAIGYEEPAWQWAGDLESARTRGSRSFTASRRVSLHVSAPATTPMTRGETKAIVADLVAQYARATSARFMIRGERVLEVVPMSFKNADGRIVRPQPLIDTLVTLDGPPALPAVWFERLVQAIGAVTGHKIRASLSGNHLTLGQPVAFTARTEPASVALQRLYSEHGVDAVFRLSYGPATKTYGMGLRTAR